MKFQTVNELGRFDFRDCQVLSAAMEEEGLALVVDALIVRQGNSQNRQPFDSYAGEARILFRDARVHRAVQEGYKHYSADEVLVEEVPDKDLTPDQIQGLPALLQGAYLYEVEKDHFEDGKTVYALEFEIPGEDPYDILSSRNYGLFLSFSQAEIGWDQYMNRVGG